MVRVFWATTEVKSQRRANREIKQNHSRRFQCPLQPQFHASFYLWLLIEAGQIPPQNLLHSSVRIIFKDGPAEQNIKCSLYWSHITLISYQYNNINPNCNSPQLKGSDFCAAASKKGVSQQKCILTQSVKKWHPLLHISAKGLIKFLEYIRLDIGAGYCGIATHTSIESELVEYCES